jgi:hypothetical protein
MRFQSLSTIALTLTVAAALAACTPEYHPEAQGEGETGAHNFLLQAVNPRPNETAAAPDQDGQRAAAAYERYRDGKVIQPKALATSQTGGGK